MVDKITEELKKQARDADKEDRELATVLQVLIATDGWKAYVRVLERRMQSQADKILGPSKSVDGCIALEYEKGALSGLVIARDLPSVIIAATKELRQPEDVDNAA
jgi:hypothetical protein